MITASVVCDAVFAFDVDLPLRMVGADMAVVAGLGSADLFEAELMTYVTFCALPPASAPTAWQLSQAKCVIAEPSISAITLRDLSGANCPSGID
jgi:hypothetical protein